MCCRSTTARCGNWNRAWSPRARNSSKNRHIKRRPQEAHRNRKSVRHRTATTRLLWRRLSKRSARFRYTISDWITPWRSSQREWHESRMQAERPLGFSKEPRCTIVPERVLRLYPSEGRVLWTLRFVLPAYGPEKEFAARTLVRSFCSTLNFAERGEFCR